MVKGAKELFAHDLGLVQYFLEEAPEAHLLEAVAMLLAT
jgi:hypothetical protein